VSTFTLLDTKLEKRFRGVLDLSGDWQIGVIVGRSGTGKTSIAKNLYYCPVCDHVGIIPDGEPVLYCKKCAEKGLETVMLPGYIRGFQYGDVCVLEDFPKTDTVTDITKTLDTVGFASPPDWLKRYECLSQGEKMRVDVARALRLNQKMITFDEWTSVVDRQVAKIASLAVSKAVRRIPGRRFVAVTCHYDILDWLEPDWSFDTETMKQTIYKKKDHTLPSSFMSIVAIPPCGKCFGSIII